MTSCALQLKICDLCVDAFLVQILVETSVIKQLTAGFGTMVLGEGCTKSSPESVALLSLSE